MLHQNNPPITEEIKMINVCMLGSQQANFLKPFATQKRTVYFLPYTEHTLSDDKRVHLYGLIGQEKYYAALRPCLNKADVVLLFPKDKEELDHLIKTLKFSDGRSSFQCFLVEPDDIELDISSEDKIKIQKFNYYLSSDTLNDFLNAVCIDFETLKQEKPEKKVYTDEDRKSHENIKRANQKSNQDAVLNEEIHFLKMPVEVHVLIFSLLDYRSLANLMLTTQIFKEMLQGNFLDIWQKALEMAIFSTEQTFSKPSTFKGISTVFRRKFASIQPATLTLSKDGKILSIARNNGSSTQGFTHPLLENAKTCNSHEEVLDLLEKIKETPLLGKLTLQYEGKADYPHYKANHLFKRLGFVKESSEPTHFDKIHKMIDFVRERQHEMQGHQEKKSRLPKFLRKGSHT